MRLLPDACVLIYMIERLGIGTEFTTYCKQKGIVVPRCVVDEVCHGDPNGGMDWLEDHVVDDPVLPDEWKPELPNALSNQDRKVIQASLDHGVVVVTNDDKVVMHTVKHGGQAMGPRRVLKEMQEQGLLTPDGRAKCEQELMVLLKQD